MSKIVILGAGGFGTSLAVMLYNNAYEVTLWSAFPEELQGIRLYGENRRLLPGVMVDPSIHLTSELDCLEQAEAVFFAVPSFAVRRVCQKLAGEIPPQAVLINVGKGFEEDTGKRLSVILQEEFPENEFVVLSGPSHAEEIARGIPTTMVAAGKTRHSAEYVQDLLMNTELRIYVNDDVIGVELGGALKNIIALCAGICDGMELGDNSKAALMTRGLAEIARLGVVMGAQVETFAGLSGMGDLIVTCTSMHSRNRRAGIYIGQGLSAQEAIERVGMTVEGYQAAQSAHRLAKQYHVDMPIVWELYQVLYQGKSVKQAVSDLMIRPKRHEDEQIWLSSK